MIKEYIWNKLKEYPEGIKRKELFQHLIPTFKDDREMRAFIKQMIFEGYPIGSSTKRGYFIIKNQQDFDEAIETYKKKIMGMFKIIKKLKENVEKEQKIQLELNLEI